VEVDRLSHCLQEELVVGALKLDDCRKGTVPLFELLRFFCVEDHVVALSLEIQQEVTFGGVGKLEWH
jgi:hypothetical protein